MNSNPTSSGPSEQQEGIVLGSFQSGNQFGPPGNITTFEILALSQSNIETLDLISEGEIEGLISGRWNFSGVLGETGWRNASFTSFRIPTGYTGIQWLRS